MTYDKHQLSRRRMLAISVAALLGSRLTQRAFAEQVSGSEHDNFISPPKLVPDPFVLSADGKTLRLHQLLQGRATAVQFIFTECKTVCPIQGAVFHRVQELLPSNPTRPVQLLSLSIDPESDNPALLTEWLGHFNAKPGWTAATPDKAALASLRAFFGDGSPLDRHTTQVHLIDPQCLWIWRTYNLPSAETVANLLSRVKAA